MSGLFDRVGLADDFMQEVDRRSMSYREAARIMGIPQSTLSRVINGQGINADSAVRICRFIGLPMDHYALHEEQIHTHSVNEVFAPLLQVGTLLRESGSIGYLRFDNGETFRIQVVRARTRQ